MASFPTGPVYGQTVLIGAITFYYNGFGWVPQNSGQVNYTFSSTSPPFASVSKGHMWIKSDTLEQFIYVIDDNNADVWLSLGAASANINFTKAGRNIIVNGSGNISQRWVNNTIGLTGTSTFVVDRWQAASDQSGKLTAGRNYSNVGLPDGFTSCIGFKTTTAATVANGDACLAEQLIEGTRLKGLQWGSANAKPLTISFWVYSNVAGTYSFFVRKIFYSVVWSYIKDITHAGTGWQYFSFTIPANTSSPTSADWDYDSASCQLTFGFNLGTGNGYSTATTEMWQNVNAVRSLASTQIINTLNHAFCVTGVQMEIGSTATDYEHIPFNQELDICQSYFQKTYFYDVPIGTADLAGCVVSSASNSFLVFTVPYRKSFIRYADLSITPGTVTGFGSLGRFNNSISTPTCSAGNQSDNSFVFNSNNNATVNNYNYFHWWAQAEPVIL